MVCAVQVLAKIQKRVTSKQRSPVRLRKTIKLMNVSRTRRVQRIQEKSTMRRRCSKSDITDVNGDEEEVFTSQDNREDGNVKITDETEMGWRRS